MAANPIDQNKKFKDQKKIQKTASDLEKKLQKRLESEKLKYDKLKEQSASKIFKRYDKKLERRLSKITNEYNRKRIDTKKKILGKEVKKKLPSISKMKSKALASIQKYAKLSRSVYSKKWPMVFILDKQMRVLLDKNVNWWHVYPQSNFRNMMFVENNIWPISNWWNKVQADNIAEWRFNLPKWIQKWLEKLSNEKWEKWKLMGHNDYQKIIDKYDSLNNIEMQRLWMI